jgi:hypothetical protein
VAFHVAYSVRHFRCFRELQGSYGGTKIKTKVPTICKTAVSMVSCSLLISGSKLQYNTMHVGFLLFSSSLET